MNCSALLADGVSRGDKIAVLVLCIVIAVLLVTDIILVVTLHRLNNKLASKQSE